MNSKKKRSAQAAINRQRKQLKLLRDKGLIKRFDARRKITPAQKKSLTKYADVVSGKAAVISAKDKKQAAKFKNSFKVVGDKIIVPKTKGERVAFSKKTGELKTTRKVGGKSVTKTISDGELAPLGKGQYYVISFAGGQKFRTNDFKTLQNFMAGYEKKPQRPFKDWRQYVEIETIDEAEGNEIAISKYKPVYKRLNKKTRGTRSRRK